MRMQVCNHPDLFEGRPIVSAFDMPGLVVQLPSRALRALETGPFERFDAATLGLRLEYGMGMASWEAQTVQVPPEHFRGSIFSGSPIERCCMRQIAPQRSHDVARRGVPTSQARDCRGKSMLANRCLPAAYKSTFVPGCWLTPS